jgi:transaldolase
MKPAGLQTKIFLDSGDPQETKDVLAVLGFLDGQTTNPTLVAKNPYARERFEKGEKFSPSEIFDFYKKVVTEISDLIPHGSVSIEVYADHSTAVDTMFQQGKDMFTWIPNAQVKYPILPAGLAAAEKSIQAGMRVNMTLCFTEEQAAAVYAATRGAKKGDVFVSPFVGRLDDRKENGMALIKNIVTMYKAGDGHAEVLSASVRNMEHFKQSIAVGADIITAPASVLIEWGKAGMPIPGADYVYNTGALSDIPYVPIDLNKAWNEYDITHELTTKGIERFASDWNALIAQ